MVKESRNFRLSSEVLELLQHLSDSWGISQAQVLELLVKEAVRESRELRAVPTK